MTLRVASLAGPLICAALVWGCAAQSVVASGEPTPGASAEPTPGASAPMLPTEPPRVELTVLAAASLRGVFGDLARAYETARPGVSLALTFDASSALRAQVESGAIADVFASADTDNPQRLADEGLASGAARVFAGNELALVTPVDDPGGISGPYDLARPGVRIVAAGPDVPITAYAAQLFRNLEAYRGAQAGLTEAIERNMVSREDNVRAVLAKIELGEGDAAIVYATDARMARVRVVALPSGVNVRTDLAAVALGESGHPAEAAAFVDWLRGPDASAILVGRGFLPPR